MRNVWKYVFLNNNNVLPGYSSGGLYKKSYKNFEGKKRQQNTQQVIVCKMRFLVGYEN